MAAGDGNAGRLAHRLAAGEDLPDDVVGQLADRHADDGQREQRPPAHGIDVGQRIGGGDAAELERVVDDGHEEIGGRHDRLLVVQPVHGGVVAMLDAHQQVGIGRCQMRGEGGVGEDVAQHGWRDLAAAAAAVGELGRHRARRRCGRLPAERRAGDRRDHRFLHAHRRRPLRVRPHRRHQCAVRRLRHGRKTAVRAGHRRHADRQAAERRIRQILAGGESVCKAAGIPIAGGHSIDAPEPIYGLVGIGVVDPAPGQAEQRRPGRRRAHPRQAARRRHLQRGAEKRPAERGPVRGDDRHHHPAQHRRRRSGRHRRRARHDRHHRLWPARPPARNHPRLERCSAHIGLASLPLLPGVAELAQAGHVTGASERNWASYGTKSAWPASPTGSGRC